MGDDYPDEDDDNGWDDKANYSRPQQPQGLVRALELAQKCHSEVSYIVERVVTCAAHGHVVFYGRVGPQGDGGQQGQQPAERDHLGWHERENNS